MPIGCTSSLFLFLLPLFCTMGGGDYRTDMETTFFPSRHRRRRVQQQSLLHQILQLQNNNNG